MYALNLGADGRVLSATEPQYAPEGAALVAGLPEGDLADYRMEAGALVYDPLPVSDEPTDDDAEALLLETAGDHEYRLCLIELGVSDL